MSYLRMFLDFSVKTQRHENMKKILTHCWKLKFYIGPLDESWKMPVRKLFHASIHSHFIRIEMHDQNGILLPKLFWPTVRKKCSSDREKLLKFEAEGREFVKLLWSLEQFIQTVKGQNNFW